MQTSYPVFESGQVLTSRHLNDLVEYLDEQDRLTRNKLVGIGIVCGFEVDYRSQENVIRISQGCAVTSEGYLIAEGESTLSQRRKYVVPVPSVEEASADEIAQARYPFFFSGNQQIAMWELLPPDHVPGPGEPNPIDIDNDFLDGKVVLLFLECKRESLKNCDINDCSDKGAEVEFTLRKLLIDQSDAIEIFKREQEVAQRPVDRHNHARYSLKELHIEKINPSGNGISNFDELYSRILDISTKLAPNLQSGLHNSYNAYRYMLAGMYPAADFPNGPFGDTSYFRNVLAGLSNNIYLVQYVYDYFSDMVQAYNEFLRAAIEVDAECCPNPDRFPKHALLGNVVQHPTAFSPGAGGADPLTGNTGVGPATKPAALRHHFIPSMLFDRQHERLERARSLHIRLYLLTLRLNAGALFETQIKITPSKEGDYALSLKAIPGYYQFQSDDDLHRNWCFDKTVRNQLDRVYSYQITDPADIPLADRLDDHNFYRVEGIVGQKLGDVMQELITQKQQLGLSFGIEPVYIGLNVKDDEASTRDNDQALSLAQEAVRKILFCRMRDLDVVFLILMGALFSYLVFIIRHLSNINTSVLARLPRRAATSRNEPRAVADFTQPTRLSSFVRAEDNLQAGILLKHLRPTRYTTGFVTSNVTTVDDPEASIGALYNTIRDAPSTTDLSERTLEFVRGLDPAANPQDLAQNVYPAIALLDRTEKLIDVASSPSIAHFDFTQFQVRYDGFVEAFDAYRAQARVDPDDTDPQIAKTNQAVLVGFGAVASSGPVSLLSNLAGELQERIRSIFGELVLDGYAKRHPGMEHKSGVPRGGTLILLYSRKSALSQVLTRNRDRVNAGFTAMRSAFLANLGAVNIALPTDRLVIHPSPPNPLDDFVVLADFCVPYLCCDSDCSDIELEEAQPVPPNRPVPTRPPTDRPRPTPRPIPRPIPRPPASPIDPAFGAPTRPPIVDTSPVPITGIVLGAPVDPTSGSRTLRSARVRLINVETNETVPVKVKNGRFKFSAPPGAFRLDAEASATFKPHSSVITITPEMKKEMEITLERQK